MASWIDQDVSVSTPDVICLPTNPSVHNVLEPILDAYNFNVCRTTYERKKSCDNYYIASAWDVSIW